MFGHFKKIHNNVLIIQVKLVSLQRWKKIDILQSYPNVPYLLYCTIWYSLPASSWADFGGAHPTKVAIPHSPPTFAWDHQHWPHFCITPFTLTKLCICPSTTSFFNHDKCMCHCFHTSACLLFCIMIVEHFDPRHILMQNKCIITVEFTESNWSVILLNNSIHNS